MYKLFYTNRNYTSGQGERCSLEDHLLDLQRWHGTPDFWDSFDDLGKACDAARANPNPITVTDDDYNVVYTA